MRNTIEILSLADARRVAATRGILEDLSRDGYDVEMTYVKRDGSRSSATGSILELGGVESSSFVKVLTERGPRTVNLLGIEVLG